jgi:hypothetical protein
MKVGDWLAELLWKPQHFEKEEKHLRPLPEGDPGRWSIQCAAAPPLPGQLENSTAN